jgi:hypothetical protein
MKKSSIITLLTGTVVLTSFITLMMCHQFLLAPRDKVIKVLMAKINESEVADLVYATHFKNIRSDMAITYCEKEITLKHVAALEWFDTHKIVIGQPAFTINQFLALALAKKTKDGVTVYKFPLAPPAGNYQLPDEPRAQYNHYSVQVDETTGLISGKGFNRYKW